MSPHHFAKTIASPHFTAPGYKDSVEGKQEQKFYLFCERLKYTFLSRLRRKRHG